MGTSSRRLHPFDSPSFCRWLGSGAFSGLLGNQVAEADDGGYLMALDDDIGRVKAHLNRSELRVLLQLSGQCKAALPHVLQHASGLGVLVRLDREGGLIRQDLHRRHRLSIPGVALGGWIWGTREQGDASRGLFGDNDDDAVLNGDLLDLQQCHDRIRRDRRLNETG